MEKNKKIRCRKGEKGIKREDGKRYRNAAIQNDLWIEKLRKRNRVQFRTREI